MENLLLLSTVCENIYLGGRGIFKKIIDRPIFFIFMLVISISKFSQSLCKIKFFPLFIYQIFFCFGAFFLIIIIIDHSFYLFSPNLSSFSINPI